MGEHSFQAEVGRVLSLVINSLYSNKDIFLRELLSNASDALDKLRFRALTEPALLDGAPDLLIRITPDAAKGVLTLEDTGIGMTEGELIENLGTVAKSGSLSFLQKLEEHAKKDVSILGQFGVGFYSAYLVADRVEVISRAAGADKAWRWESSGRDTFTVEEASRSQRGTSVILHVKEEHKALLEPWRIRELVRRYSDYLAYPIELVTAPGGSDAHPEDAKREVINRASALWRRPKSEITADQYEELYKHITHAFDTPLAHTHFQMEGNVEAVGLLWIPREAPFDLDDPRKQRGVRLFVKRVLIMEDCDALLPQWLRFLRGIVDSDDLPLNVSRELLQDSSALRTIRKTVTKRVLDRLDELAEQAPESYRTFWETFGRILKEGLVVDPEFKERIAKLTRWHSTGGTEWMSLDEYIKTMKDGQEAIYYATGESTETLSNSPTLEALRAQGYAVLLMTEPIDALSSESLEEYDGKKLVNAMRSDLSIPSDPKQATHDGDFEPLLKAAKAVLGERVHEVRLSTRLVDSPACLVLPASAVSPHLEKMLRQAGRVAPQSKRDLELNPSHGVIKKLNALARDKPEDDDLAMWLTLLHEQAIVSEGGALQDPHAFVRRVTQLLERAI